MKKLFFTLAFVALAITSNAVPALRGQWKTLTLSDGTQIKAELCGDEFMSYWQTADGGKYVSNEATGYYEPADIEAMTAKAAEARAAVNASYARRAAARVSLGDASSDYKGLKKGLIILVQFSDLQFEDSHTPELYKQIANEEGFTSDLGFVGSVKDYFKAQSYGQFEIDFDVAGPVTMPNGYAYYGKNVNGMTANAEGLAEMITTSCEEIDSEVDYNDYDWDGDGEADLVFFLYAGEGENNGGDANTIWPHMWTLSSASGGETITLDGVTIDTYACTCEIGKYGTIDGIGTICHEFSHCLGLPDMYDTSGSNYAMGNWDVLCYGNYNGHTYGDGFIPAGFTSYERWFAGWMEPAVLDEDCKVEGMQPLTDEPEAYVVYNDRVKTEYYLLENRNQTGWDAGTAASGLLILHVDFDKTSWKNNTVNASTQHYTLFPANNLYSQSYESGHPFPYGSNNSLTNSTTPASTLINSNSDGKYYMNKPITDITRSSDGTISFSFADENASGNDQDYIPESYVFYESFNLCSGKGGNDGVFSGSSVGTVALTGKTDNEVWLSSTMGYSAWMCAMFGTALFPGDATSPEITVDNDCKVIFKAAPYTGDGNNLKLSVASGDVTLEDTDFVMTEDEWTTFTTTINGSGAFKLNFASETGRFFLDEVYITYEGVDGIRNVSAGINDATDRRVYSIDGRCISDGSNSLKTQKGIYIVNGKKFVK